MKVKPAPDLDRALSYLQESGGALDDAVQGLSKEDCCRKREPDVWSVNEVAEHLAIIEGLFLKGAATRLVNAPPPADDFDAEEWDARVLAMARDRLTRINAPERTKPTGTIPAEQSLETFRERRAQTIHFFRTMRDLRDHVVPHPLFGPLDGYQWALLMASHTERHVNQILDLQATQRS